MKKLCSQCKASWDGQDDYYPAQANYEVKGKIQGSSRMIPYHAFICENHLNMLRMDGAELRIIKELKDLT